MNYRLGYVLDDHRRLRQVCAPFESLKGLREQARATVGMTVDSHRIEAVWIEDDRGRIVFDCGAPQD